MPIRENTPREFTRAGIEGITPNQMGVYALYKTNRWIYVGRGDIRARLLDHLNGDNACINREHPTHWVDEVTANHVERERQVIVELNPVCNQRVG